MRRMLAACLVAGLTLSACGDDSHTTGASDEPKGAKLSKSSLARSTTPSQDNVAALGSGNRAFAFELYKRAAAANAGANVVLSPYSVSSALAMAYAGARTTTESEMKSTLHFTLEQAPLAEAFNAVDLALRSRGEGLLDSDRKPKPAVQQVRVNNSLWAQVGTAIVPAFLDTLAVNYGAGVYLTDFNNDAEGARKAINAWVALQTDDLITELLGAGSIMPTTRLVLTNTVYFNAEWYSPFVRARTADGAFTRLDGSTVTASLMKDEIIAPYADGDDYKAVQLAYNSNGLSMLAILPSDGKFAQVEGELNGAWFDALASKLQRAGKVEITMPKFQYKSHVSLKDSLKALGMNVAFGEGADFSGMIEKPVLIDDVIHESTIDVFEDGTIAAAATAVTFRDVSAALNPPNIVMNRPFLFAIWDQPTGEILFVGRVLDPTVH